MPGDDLEEVWEWRYHATGPTCYYVQDDKYGTMLQQIQLPLDKDFLDEYVISFKTPQPAFDGIMVTDSLVDVYGEQESNSIWGKSEKARVEETKNRLRNLKYILQQIYKVTGYKVLVVQYPQASFPKGTVPDVSTFMHIYPMKAHFFILWALMGKEDLYPPGRRTVALPAISERATRLLYAAQCKDEKWQGQQTFIFGGSAKTWQYRKTFKLVDCQMYDLQVNNIIDNIEDTAFVTRATVVSGAEVFEDLDKYDKMGHTATKSAALFANQFDTGFTLRKHIRLTTAAIRTHTN